MTGAPDLLFVYGTLRPHAPWPSGEAQRAAQALQDGADYLGPARMKGKLYRVSWYPGLRDSLDTRDVVHGDVFATPPDILDTLDMFEGASTAQDADTDYVRRRRSVTLADGRRVLAWTYLYQRAVDPLSRIDSGDFILDAATVRGATR